MVDDYKSRLQAAMRAKKVTAAELQAKLGITVQAVRKVLGEPGGGRFGTANHIAVCKWLGINGDWLSNGTPPQWAGEVVRPAPTLSEALGVLGDALAVEMPDDVRQDAADLLSKLAHRKCASWND